MREATFRTYLHDEDAVALNLMFCDVLHTWDDLVDQDKPVAPEAISKAFRTALVEIPQNKFYRRHFDELAPLVDHFILSWLTANRFEADGDIDALRIAFIARSDYMALFLRSIQIVSGFEYAASVAPEIRRYWHAEGWDGYLVNLTNEQINRGRK